MLKETIMFGCTSQNQRPHFLQLNTWYKSFFSVLLKILYVGVCIMSTKVAVKQIRNYLQQWHGVPSLAFHLTELHGSYSRSPPNPYWNISKNEQHIYFLHCVFKCKESMINSIFSICKMYYLHCRYIFKSLDEIFFIHSSCTDTILPWGTTITK